MHKKNLPPNNNHETAQVQAFVHSGNMLVNDIKVDQFLIQTLNDADHHELNKIFTVLDMYQFPALDEHSAETVITTFMHNTPYQQDCFSPEALHYIRTIFVQAEHFLSNYLKRPLMHSFLNKFTDYELFDKLKNKKQLIKFLMNASSINNPTFRQPYCSLIKLAYIINYYQKQKDTFIAKEEEFCHLIHNAFLNHVDCFNKTYNHITSLSMKNNKLDNIYCMAKNDSPLQGVNFTFSARIKSEESILIKLLIDEKYDKLKALKDIHAGRCEVQNLKDGINLLQYLYSNVFDQVDSIENKHFITQEEFGHLPGVFSNDFTQVMNSVFDQMSKDTFKNDINYKDIKIIGKIEEKPVEIQITLVNNQNESGFSHHAHYDIKKKIRAIERLQGYITETMIKKYIYYLVEQFPEHYLPLCNIHKPRNSLTSEDMDCVYAVFFEYYYKTGFLYKLSIPETTTKVKYFVTKKARNRSRKRIKEKGLQSFYPDGAQVFDYNKNQRTCGLV